MRLNLSVGMNRLLEAAMWLIVVWLGYAWVEAASKTLDWRLWHDAPLMHYIAWRMREGDVPYRDLFDMNFPLTYALHLLAMTMFGDGDAGWRWFDLAWLGFTVSGIGLYLKPQGWLTSAAAMILYMDYHLFGGHLSQGQRDFLLVGFLAWSLYFLSGLCERERPTDALGAGFMLAAGFWLKPVFGVFALMALAYVVVVHGRWRAVLRVAAWGGFFSAMMLAWLALMGALQPFWAMLTQFILPLYPTFGGGHGWIAMYVQVLTNGGAVAAFFLLPAVRTPRMELAALAALYGMFHLVLQDKNFTYHYYPATFGLAMLALCRLGDCLRQPAWYPRLAALFALAVSAYLLGPAQATHDYYLAPMSSETVDAMVSDIKALALPEQETIQAMDTTVGAINALYQLKRRQPTRFIYDFPLYNATDNAAVQRYQAEFMADMQSTPPAAVLLTWQSWPSGDSLYDRVALIPGLQNFLESGYTLSVDKPFYRIYVRNP